MHNVGRGEGDTADGVCRQGDHQLAAWVERCPAQQQISRQGFIRGRLAWRRVAAASGGTDRPGGRLRMLPVWLFSVNEQPADTFNTLGRDQSRAAEDGAGGEVCVLRRDRDGGGGPVDHC